MSGRAQPRKLIVEADGGSRGNPGLAGYGALVRDPATGEVLEETWPASSRWRSRSMRVRTCSTSASALP